MNIDDYFASLERGLRQNPLVSHLQEPFVAPHHPETITFPHHKHIGLHDRIAPSDQPSLSQVLAEIADWLDRYTD